VRAQAAILPAAQLLAALSAPAQGALHLTRVVALPAGAYLSQNEREAILQQAKQYLRSLVDQLRAGLFANPVADLQLSLTWSVTIDTDIAAAIIRGAEQGEDAEGAGVAGSSQVIAMATHGYSGLQRWVMGSITQRVLHGSLLPLLIVRPPDMTDKGQQT
jgi:nucleotide-binding universal stress UspA family protein